jgi:transposase
MLFQDEKIHIGIDVSKSTLDLYILPCKKLMQFKNTSGDIKKLTKKLSTFGQPFIVMEATGGYEKPLAQSLGEAGFHVSVVNPRSIRDFAKALGKLAKTDQIDAEVIASFAEKIQPAKTMTPSRNQRNLAAFNTRRHQLIEMIGMEKNRLDKTIPELEKSVRRVIRMLENELAEINSILEKLIQKDESFSHKSKLLNSIKGVGPVVSTGVIANLPELGTLNARQIAALAGLAPYNRDSGTLRGKRTIWGGRASVRKTLYMATLVATRHNFQIRSFYVQLCNRGKSKKLAIVACMRKLLIVMNAMIKNNQPWRSVVI